MHTNTSGRNNGQSKNNAFIKGDSSPAVAPSQSSRRTQTKIDFNDDRNEDVNNEYSEFYLGDGRYIDMNHNGLFFQDYFDYCFFFKRLDLLQITQIK